MALLTRNISEFLKLTLKLGCIELYENIGTSPLKYLSLVQNWGLRINNGDDNAVKLIC